MTISEIARKAGVSSATVSRVLNESGYVSESTRKKVLEVIEDNEFVPNEMARGLSKKDSNNIAVFVADIENTFFSRAVRGITDVADSYGYNVVLFNTDENVEKEQRYLQTAIGLQCRGIIIAPIAEDNAETQKRLDRMKNQGVPVVLLDRDIRGLSLDGIFSEDVQGAYEAANALIAQGHRRIAIIKGPDNTRPGRERMEGFLRALDEHGIPLPPEYIRDGKFRLDASYDSARALLELPQPPTAIFTVNNLSSYGCMKCLAEKDLVIGRDVSLIGFDALDELDDLGIRLSAVSRSFTEMGRRAMQLLEQRIRHPSLARVRRLRVPTRLLLRGSEKIAADAL
ncbi:MAG: LacI family DNA-binding transcriptional regulator [Oscillospiraceae bacterium]|nr:LacI family DNA-binding transcriptional regulator [Oscillospiraceae bacterium]